MSKLHSNLEERDFTAYVGLVKASTDESGEMAVYGPIASEQEDHEGDVLSRTGIIKGLKSFVSLGCHVDVEHQYSESVKKGKPDPELVIGRGEVFYVDGRPWLKTVLQKGNRIARDIYDKVKAGHSLGYSIEGKGIRQGKRVVSTIIKMITISLFPMGKDQHLQASAPAGAQFDIVKAMRLMCEGGVCGWKPVTPETQIEIVKAFTTGSGIVGEGSTGGAALRSQSLVGAPGRRPRRRKRSRLYKALVNRLANIGASDPEGVASALLPESGMEEDGMSKSFSNRINAILKKSQAPEPDEDDEDIKDDVDDDADESDDDMDDTEKGGADNVIMGDADSFKDEVVGEVGELVKALQEDLQESFDTIGARLTKIEKGGATSLRKGGAGDGDVLIELIKAMGEHFDARFDEIDERLDTVEESHELVKGLVGDIDDEAATTPAKNGGKTPGAKTTLRKSRVGDEDEGDNIGELIKKGNALQESTGSSVPGLADVTISADLGEAPPPSALHSLKKALSGGSDDDEE